MTIDEPDPSMPADSGRIHLPEYGRGALCDVLPSVATALGVGDTGVLGLAPHSRACVFLVDGLGAASLREHADTAPFLASVLTGAEGRELTAGFPATTATSLGSFGTGMPPGAHGMLGYRVAVPGAGRMINLLRWDADVDPTAWQPRDTVLERIAAAGIAVTHVSAGRFAGSGLTRSVLRGGAFVGAESGESRVRAAIEALRAADRGLVYVYYAALDLAGHAHGVASEQWREELATVDRLARGLADRLPAGAVLYVTADHGMVDVPPAHRLDFDQDPELRAGVAMIGGDGRARHLYAHPGAARDVFAIWRERLADYAWVRTREWAIAEGWFGPVVDDTMAARIGDVVVAMRGDWAVVASRTEKVESRLVGMHGSMTNLEQRIPFLELRA